MNDINLPQREEFVRELRSLLKNVAKKYEGKCNKNKVWTAAIFKEMQALAKRLQKRLADDEILCFHANKHGYGGEWLYDAVFWIEEQEGKKIGGIYSCVECEWGNDKDNRDFFKVLTANTDLPVFIMQVDHSDNVEREIKKRLDKAALFKGNPKPIIFVWDNETGEWHCSRDKRFTLLED